MLNFWSAIIWKRMRLLSLVPTVHFQPRRLQQRETGRYFPERTVGTVAPEHLLEVPDYGAHCQSAVMQYLYSARVRFTS